jgi:hypothetical protein
MSKIFNLENRKFVALIEGFNSGDDAISDDQDSEEKVAYIIYQI